MRQKHIDTSRMDLQEQVVHINRVTKVVKGGRNFRFSALVVVGDGNGHVGVGTGKALEVPNAIRKAIANAKKNLVKVPLRGTTIPHAIKARTGAGQVLLMPAPLGTGIIAGGGVRAVLELAGYKDVRAKSLGSSNPKSMVDATMDGLQQLMTLRDVAKLRGRSVNEILGKEV